MKTSFKLSAHRSFVGAFIVQAAVLAATVSTHASSIITWDAAQNISGDSDVSTAGTLVGAFNLGAAGVADTTVNGVTFTGLAVSGTSTTSGNFNLSSAVSISGNNSVLMPGPFGLSSPYEALISSEIFTFGLPITLTMNGLASGATYQFEWWSSDNFGPPITTTATAGNSVSLQTTTGAYGPFDWMPGQFAIGTFVADATTSQTITFSTAYFAEINGFQLRQTATVPDMGSTLVLIGLGLLAIVAISRRARSPRKA